MNKKYLFLGLLFFVSSVLALFAIKAWAETPSDIQYPVAELGGCTSESSCKTYCDKPDNMTACLDFAQKYNLMSQDEISTAKKFAAAGGKGPGGCTGKDSCEAYCNDTSHMEECIAFAEKNDLIPANELADAKKVREAMKRGLKPPACTNKKSCDSYCEAPEHMEECITFASEAGLMPDEEKTNAQKMLAAIKRGVKPLPCKGKDECEAFCQQPTNMETCITFASEAGFMSEQEKADSQKMLGAIKKGVMPPPCKGKEECDAYCQQDDHIEQCINFAVATGNMDPKDAEMAKKTKGKGPGGCKSNEECTAFCNTPENQQTCFQFAKDNGMIAPEELQKMQEGQQKMQGSFNNMAPETKDCLVSAIGQDNVSKMRSGEFMPDQQTQEQIQKCINIKPKQPEGSEGPKQTGPGGCTSPQECESYCQQHPQECGAPGPGQEQEQQQNEQRGWGEGQFDEGRRQPGQGSENMRPPEDMRPREPGINEQPGSRPMPPQEFNNQPMPPTENNGMMPPRQGSQEPAPQQSMEQPAPQTQQQPQQEMAPPPPPPLPEPAPSSAPSSFLNNQYLGALIRFLIGDYQ